MPTTEARTGIALPLISDGFDTSELAANFQTLADHSSVKVCTSGTRPGTWGAAHEGMLIVETDTELLWRWNGTAFVRHGASGFIDNNRRTSDLTITGGSYVVVAQAAVTIPEGGRNIQVQATWGEVSGGPARMALFRGATQLMDWKAVVDGPGATVSFIDLGPTSGAATYYFKAKNTSTTTTIECAADSPATLDVVEV